MSAAFDLDLYADTVTPPAPVAPRSGPSSGWFGWLLAVIAIVFLAFVLVHRAPMPDGDDIKPTPSVSGLHVLIVEETSDRYKLPASQVAIFTSIPLREWYAANCAKDGDAPAYRCFDEQDDLKNESAEWRDIRSRVTLKPPCYLVVDGKRGQEGRLPEDPERFQQLLEQFKAKK